MKNTSSNYEEAEGEESVVAPIPVDPQDPIYDSQSEASEADSYYELKSPSQRPDSRNTKTSFSVGYALVSSAPELTQGEFEEAAQSIIKEFARTNNPAVAVDELKDLRCSLYMDLFVVSAIKCALDLSSKVQGNFASLLTLLHDSHVISKPQMMRAFEKLIQASRDLKMDVPNVHDQLFLFFTVAVDDQVIDSLFLNRLPEFFIRQLSDTILSNEPSLVRQADELKIYKCLLSEKLPELLETGLLEEVGDFLEKSDELLSERIVASNLPPIPNEKSAESLVSSEPSPISYFYKHEFVRKLLTLACSQSSDLKREFVSKCLNEFFGRDASNKPGVHLLDGDDIQLGVSRLISEIEDVSLDCPCAFEMISKFIVRMVVDEILPPAFIKDFLRMHLGGRGGLDVLKRAKRWISQSGHKPHVLAERFSKVWTATDDLTPETHAFKKRLQEIIFSYFDTEDLELCVWRLGRLEMTPDQAVESARKVIEYAMERKQKAWKHAIKLLVELSCNGEFDPETVVRGFDQLYKKIDDLVKDIPACREQLKDFFVPEAKEAKLIPEDYTLEIGFVMK